MGPLAPIVGALLGSALTAFVTYYVLTKRKKVAFWVTSSEDITLPLQNRHHNIVLNIGDKTIVNLNRAGVQIENSGNTCIAQFACDLELPGKHQICFAEVGARNTKLRNSVRLEKTSGSSGEIVTVSLDFFNPGEAFQVLAYFDGTTEDLKVNFRMEEVRFKVQQGAY